MRRWQLVLVVCGFTVVATAQGPPGPGTTASAKPLSERVVAYQIDARLDVKSKTLDATEVLTYRNLTGHPLQQFPFHLYLNAFQPKSTFVQELRLNRPQFQWKQKYNGSVEVKSFEVVGRPDLRPELSFIQPDDNNPDDRTVLQVRMPEPVPPGAQVQFKIVFHDRLPEALARTGYKDEFFFGGQWFPKVGVWWQGAWNCHQFHATTEFFADFGTYDVKLTLPKNYVVGATGEQVGVVNNPDGTQTVSFHGEDIHDFAWTADPHYRVVEDSFTGSAGTVKIRLLMQPDHVSQAPRYLQSLKGTMELLDRWYGPYPYKQITVVDPAPWSRAGGMEYPTLITADTLVGMPAGLRLPEDVVVHEFAHQYWYGMVATNEFEEAWLDEGLTAFTEIKVMEALYGKKASGIDLWGATASMAGIERMIYGFIPDSDPLVRRGYQFMTGGAYGGVSYGKTATMLLTLESIIGEGTLRQALRTYFLRYRFTHPTGEDLLKTVEEVYGNNLRWYFEQAVYGTQVLDYQVRSIQSERLDWFEKKPSEERKGETLYRSTVLVQRKGDFIFPVELEVKFDNGEKVREHWDGRDRWVRFSYEKKAKLVSAELDPDHKIWLDKDLFNNSKTLQPHSGARRKLAAYWLFVTQFLAQLLAWLT